MRLAFSVVIGILIPGFALADTIITNITVNGTISGQGNMGIRCFGAEPGCTELESQPGSFRQFVHIGFNGTNTSGSAFAFAQGTGIGFTSIYADARQEATVTDDNISIFQRSDWYVDVGNQRPVSGYFVTVSNDISVGFDLTTVSLMQTTGFPGAQLFDSDGDLISFMWSVILQPGEYEFKQSLPLTRSGSLFSNYETQTLSFGAHFTPVPEPRYASLLCSAVLLVFLIQRARLSRGPGPSRQGTRADPIEPRLQTVEQAAVLNFP